MQVIGMERRRQRHARGWKVAWSLALSGLWCLCVARLPPFAGAAPRPTGILVAQATDPTPIDPLYFARWNINYGEYLLDVGRYLEALEAFQTAAEATTNPRVKAEASLHRATALAGFREAFEDAAHKYERLHQD